MILFLVAVAAFRCERSRTISRAVGTLKTNAALHLVGKVHFRRVLVAQALWPVLCFLLLSNQCTAKSGCATDSFRKLFSRRRLGMRVITHTGRAALQKPFGIEVATQRIC